MGRHRLVVLSRITVLLLTLAVVLVAAKQPLLECGTYIATAQEEAFLHLTHTVHRARARLAAIPSSNSPPPVAPIQRDIGDIAVIDGGSGVVGQRNPFNLSAHSVRFDPVAGGYAVQTFDNSGSTNTSGVPPDASSAYDPAAAQNGTFLSLTDDDSKRITLPFPFTFYGTTYREAYVNSNGTASFTQGNADYNTTFGNFTVGLPTIAGLFTDLNPPSSTDGVRVLADASRVVISWVNVPLATSSFGSGNSFQIRIYPQGRVELAYALASVDNAVVGITAGKLQPVSLTDLSSLPLTTFTGGIAEVFSSTASVDMRVAAQRFYQTHDDAYDYLVVYNAMGVSAGSGIVAYELTTRSKGEGYGDTPTNNGVEYGSPKRLQSVLNLGPVTQYPADPYGPVPSRGPTGDTPMSILGHESGHLFLALVSVPSPTNSLFLPMLGAGNAHWAYTFNSDASFMEGNRIADGGPTASPRFRTTDTVQHYSDVDQYLMGFLPPQQVSPTFAVLNSGQSNSRAPQAGVSFGGTRLDIGINDIIQAAGRRTPDSTVAQRQFRFAFIVIVPEGSDLTAGSPATLAVQQVERYRAEFPDFYAKATNFQASATTSLKRDVLFSLWPAAGLTALSTQTVSLSLSSAALSPVTFHLEPKASDIVGNPGTVTIPAGQSSVQFELRPFFRTVVEHLTFTPDDTHYHATDARLQVSFADALHVELASGDAAVAASASPVPQTITLRVVDKNKLTYAGVDVTAVASAGGKLENDRVTTSANGEAIFIWTPAASGTTNTLTATLTGVPGSQVVISAQRTPQVFTNGVVHAATFGPQIAPGSFVSIYGASLSNGVTATAVTPLLPMQFPTVLGNVRVRINGTAVPMVYVSDSQLNIQLPTTISTGSAILAVETSAGVSAPVTIQIVPVAPGIFVYTAAAGEPSLDSAGFGTIVVAGTTIPTWSRSAKPGEYLEIYCTGLGNSPQATANIGGVDVPVTYAGNTVAPGLQQVNVFLPAGVPSGTQDLYLTINGVRSNAVKVGIGK